MMQQGMPGGPPVMVLNAKTQRSTGRAAQLGNIAAAKGVASIIRTTLGPRSMLKMLLDPMGGIVLTNDGHCILREVDVSHPTAKSMIELSRAQDEEVGDGTTSVIVLASQVLSAAEPFLRLDGNSNNTSGIGGSSIGSNMYHPTVLVQAYTKALAKAIEICEQQAITIDVFSLDDKNDKEREQTQQKLRKLVESSIGTKFSSRWNEKMVEMALQAVLTVATKPPTTITATTTDTGSTSTAADEGSASTTSPTTTNKTIASYDKTNSAVIVDLKRYAKVEKIPGGEISDSEVLKGIMFQKDITHSKMKREIKNPRILLLDTPLEYKKGESQTNMEITNENDWNTLLRMEEDYVENMCMEIIAHKPDIVITEKGVSDLAQHYLQKAGITAFRRLRKTDNNRIAKAVGATIISRTDEITEQDIGTDCGLFTMKKINDEWFVYLTDCTNPKACTVVLRGGSKDILNEIERNLQDAMQVVRNVVYNPKLVYGGGAIEMAIAVGLQKEGLKSIKGIQQGPYQAVGEAMEIIPSTLAQNCGVSVIRSITQLRAKHNEAYDKAEQQQQQQQNDNNKTVDTTSEHKENNQSTTTGSATTIIPKCTWGINGITGKIVNMEEEENPVWEPLSVKIQTIKTAIESACMILRIDDIVSGSKRK